MAKYQVFGIPITEETLRAMPLYYGNNVITRAEMALVARDEKNFRQQQDECINFVQKLQKEYVGEISTLCTVYNATGGDLTLLLSHDWSGNVYNNQYPLTIRNGQWAGWLHVPNRETADGYSSGMVAYRGMNNSGTLKAWANCWEITGKKGATNKVRAEGRPVGHYDYTNPAGGWANLLTYLKSSSFSEKQDGCTAEASIGSGPSAIYCGIMSLTPP